MDNNLPDPEEERLKNAKEQIRQRILADNSPGVNGVAIHYQRKKLLVFYTDKEAAKPFVEEQLKELGSAFLDSIEWISGFPGPDEPEPPTRSNNLIYFINVLYKFLAGITTLIRPDSIIRAADDPGRVGCFLRMRDQCIGVLTAEHLFLKRQETPVKCPHDVKVKSGSYFYKAGWNWLFASNFGQGGVADCAIFRPDVTKLDLQPGQGMTIDWIPADRLGMTRDHMALNKVDPNNPKLGPVIDPDAPIKCLHSGSVDSAAILDHQILIEKLDFGISNNSGTIIVMAEDVPGAFKKGDPLGIYVYSCNTNYHHFLTPVHACFDTFQEAEEIYQP